jgi:hypothetical protein
VHVIVAQGASFPDSTIINAVIASAGAGTAIMVVLFLLGLLWTKHSVDDIKRQRDLERADKEKAQEERDAALKVVQDRVIPLLENFNAVTGGLIPLLQGLVLRMQEGGERDDRSRDRTYRSRDR